MTIGGVLFCSSFGFFVLFCFVSFLFLFCFFVCIALAAATENTGAATGADMSKVACFLFNFAWLGRMVRWFLYQCILDIRFEWLNKNHCQQLILQFPSRESGVDSADGKDCGTPSWPQTCAPRSPTNLARTHSSTNRPWPGTNLSSAERRMILS